MPERESHCRKCLRWRKTSFKELEDIDQQVLKSVPSIKEKKFVPVGNGNQLWSVSCNPQQQGTPIVMVHGMGGGVGLWTLNLDALSGKRPVHAFDLLGFGRSSRPSFSTNETEAEEMFVQAIEKYRQAMGLEKFILMGHSLGGFLCASYALRHPQHVKHLVLVDPWGMNSHPPEGRRHLPLFFRAVLSVVSLGNPLSVLRVSGPLGPRLVKRYRPELAEMFTTKLGNNDLLHSYIYHCNAQKPSGEAGFKSLMWSLGWAKRPMIERMAAMDPQVPITFIYGSLSWMNRDAAWQFQKSHNSYVDVQIVRGAGHHVYAERWDVFNDLVNNIASSVDRGELPSLDRKLVKRMKVSPIVLDVPSPDSEEPELSRH
ncbi:(Lyso)-N-acylphosphatidylethanolamine lipase-like [Babylonia areolata]|uniref:(Lyso)-N-acylphosphatidylethanolamine lipase-like n=1 Tax=Babylonia areolata TaxID=304850 RepID=UPI003FD11ED9